MSVNDWLPEFVAEHRIRHPHAGLPPYDTEEGRVVYESWRSNFVRRGIHDLDVATAASEMLAAEDHYPKDHLKLLCGFAVAVYRERSPAAAAKPSAPEFPTSPPPGVTAASRGCPECRGTGWARRHAVWLTMRRAFLLDLFCRCPAGRWRKEFDPELRKPGGCRQHDDLQARPELWDAGLRFAAWDEWPCPHDLELPEGTEGKWRYLEPGEPTPTFDREDLADCLKQTPTRGNP